MKLVGATNWFIRWPFFIEGLLLGVCGSIIPIAILLGTYHHAVQWIAPKVQGTFIQLLPYNPFVFQISAILVLIGAVIGVWGSLMSIRKFLKFKPALSPVVSCLKLGCLQSAGLP